MIGQELQKKVDLQVQKAAEAAREHLWGHLFAHLPCSEIDWSLDGGRAVCRVVDMPCYGKFFSDPSDMKKHLLSKRHCVSYTVKYDAIKLGFILCVIYSRMVS
jgi:hypothetical protein